MSKSREQQEKRKGEAGLFEHLIGPLVVGLVVLLGQSIVQPWVAEKSESRTQRWKTKEQTYVKAIGLVNAHFGALRWTGPDVESQEYATFALPDETAVNDCYAELMLLCEDREVLRLFRRCFKIETDQRTIIAQDRTDFIKVLRRDLGFEDLGINTNDVRYLKWKISSTNQVTR